MTVLTKTLTASGTPEALEEFEQMVYALAREQGKEVLVEVKKNES